MMSCYLQCAGIYPQPCLVMDARELRLLRLFPERRVTDFPLYGSFYHRGRLPQKLQGRLPFWLNSPRFN